MKTRHIILPVALALLMSSCATPSGQNQYQSSEVGVSTMVEFATVLHAREIGITGKNSGAGSLAGGALGATAASSAGGGTGQLAAVIGGAVVGAVAGHAAEQALADSVGMEYTVITESGKTMTVAQNHNKGDRLLQKGERVMIQTSGSYQRVLPAEQLPETVKRPKGIAIVD